MDHLATLCRSRLHHLSPPAIIPTAPPQPSVMERGRDDADDHDAAAAAAAEEESIPVSNRPYWTKKIHLLCSRPHGGVDDALRLLHRLRHRGYRPDALNLGSLVHALCDAGRFLEAHRRLLLFLASGSVLLDDRASNVLVARLLDARSPDLTRRVIDRLVATKHAFALSPINYNRLVDQFCSLSRPADARNVFLDMKSRGHGPNVVSYTALINGFGRVGELDAALQVFDEMLSSGVPPNPLTYSAVIKGILRKRRIEEGREMMSELWVRMAGEVDPHVNHAAFANLVDALCREGFFHEVFRLAEEMPQGRCVREDFAYGQMMDSLCRVGRHHGASRIVYIMRKRGLTPSIVSYNCIVHGLSQQGEGGCMRAYQLLKEGSEVFGYTPLEPTYKSLVEGLCRERDVNKAKDVTESMLLWGKGDIDKTRRIYNIFLNALCLVDNPSEQLNVLVSMFQNQCCPDVVSLNTVIHGFCKISKVGEALKILDDMLKGSFCAPDMVTFTTILRGLLDAGRVEEALDILHHRMPQCSCSPSTMTYNVVLHGLCKLRSVDKAMAVFDEMVQQAVSADSTTHTTIVEGLLRAGEVNQAKRFWEDVIWPSGIHNDFVYAAILIGLCNLGKLNEAFNFLYELVDCGVAPGIVNYNILIYGACKQGLKREAYQIVSEARKNGLVPDAVTWRILEKLHRNERGDPAPCLQVSKSKIVSQEEEIIFCPSTSKTIESQEEEYEVKMQIEGAAWDGTVAMNFPTKLSDIENNDDDDDDDEIKANTLFGDVHKVESPKSELREPLSRMTRRVFGLP